MFLAVVRIVIAENFHTFMHFLKSKSWFSKENDLATERSM